MRTVVKVASVMVAAAVVGAAGLVAATGWSVTGAAGEPAFELAGEYADPSRGVSDFGLRWYDPRHQSFYAVDPALVDDPAGVRAVPGLTATYALGLHNPLVYADPDGRMPRRRLLTLTGEPVEYYSDSDATMSEDSVASEADEADEPDEPDGYVGYDGLDVFDGGPDAPAGVPALVPTGRMSGPIPASVPGGDVALSAPRMDDFPDRTLEIAEQYAQDVASELRSGILALDVPPPWWWLGTPEDWRLKLASTQERGAHVRFLQSARAMQVATRNAMNRTRGPAFGPEPARLGDEALQQYRDTGQRSQDLQ